jgi:hypothetical protein
MAAALVSLGALFVLTETRHGNIDAVDSAPTDAVTDATTDASTGPAAEAVAAK